MSKPFGAPFGAPSWRRKWLNQARFRRGTVLRSLGSKGTASASTHLRWDSKGGRGGRDSTSHGSPHGTTAPSACEQTAWLSQGSARGLHEQALWSPLWSPLLGREMAQLSQISRGTVLRSLGSKGTASALPA